MRILLAHSFYRIPGGEDSHVRRQLELLGRSHEVELIEGENRELEESLSTAARMAYSKSKKREVEETITRFRPDVVHLHNVYPALGPAVHLAARSRDVPLIMTVHNFRLRCPNSFMFTEGSPCRRCERGLYVNAVVHECFPTKKQALAYASILWMHRFVLRLEKTVATFVVPSDFMRTRLVEWGIPESKVRTIRHFIDPVAKPPENVGEYGIFLGRLSSEKGLDVLLEALRHAGDPPFLVVGDGPLGGALRDEANRLGLTNTRFVGRRPQGEIPPLLADARYLAAPSRGEESAGLSGLEALAMGRPLLVSDRGALPELVADHAGFACPAGDFDALASKIRLLHSNDDLCRDMGMSALKRATGFFSPEQHVGALEKVYAAAKSGRADL